MIRHPCLEVDVPFDLFLCNRPYTPTVLIPELHLLLCTASAKINISYSILFNLTTSYSSYFGGKKGISWNKTSFFLLMHVGYAPTTAASTAVTSHKLHHRLRPMHETSTICRHTQTSTPRRH